MKRIVLALMLCLSLLLQFTACGLAGGGKEPIDVTVVYPDEQETVTVMVGEKTKITPRYLNGKVLVGFYGQDSATGTEYFDFTGAMNSAWEADFPTTVYAVYEEPDYNIGFTSTVLRKEDPHSYHYGGGKGLTFTFKSDTIEANRELYRLLCSCSNLDVIIEMHADIKQNGEYAVETSFSLSMGPETLATKKCASNPTSYTHVTVSQTIKAAQLLTDANIVGRFVWHGSRSGSYGLVKNVYYTITIVIPN